jgi:hypothetical protein
MGSTQHTVADKLFVNSIYGAQQCIVLEHGGRWVLPVTEDANEEMRSGH